MSNNNATAFEITQRAMEFCDSYASQALFLAKAFIYLGLVAGVLMAVAEAYKVYREALAIKSASDAAEVRSLAAGPASGEIVKALVGLLTGAKAWLALVILGIVMLWLAGSGAPDYCTPPQPQQPPGAQGNQARAGQPNPTTNSQSGAETNGQTKQ